MGLWGICWDLIRLRLLLKKKNTRLLCFLYRNCQEYCILILFSNSSLAGWNSCIKFKSKAFLLTTNWKLPCSTILESLVLVYLVQLCDQFSCSFLCLWQYDLLNLLSPAIKICMDLYVNGSMTSRVNVILHLFSYRSWMMLILLWERKSCQVGYSLREVKIRVKWV